jgi:NAD+ synthase (glutamine-hydrolysing)
VEIVKETGYSEKLVRDIVRKIDLNEYKRKQTPPCLRVTTKAFGIGRRVPIAQRYVEGVLPVNTVACPILMRVLFAHCLL